MPVCQHGVVGKVSDALNSNAKALNGSKILILGLAYKKNVDDVRESPALELIKLLSEKGAVLSYSDPHVLKMPKIRRHKFELDRIEVTAEALSVFDCVLLVTDHDKFDYELIAKASKLIVDTRGRYKNKLINVVKA